jgi:hypothetical protein
MVNCTAADTRRTQVLFDKAVEVSRTVRRACRTGSLILIGLSLTATIASCGRTPSELKAQASKAADQCIKIGTAFAQSLQDCLHREAPFGPLVDSETGKSTHVCYPAKETIGQICGYLEIEINSANYITGWRAESGHEE